MRLVPRWKGASCLPPYLLCLYAYPQSSTRSRSRPHPRPYARTTRSNGKEFEKIEKAYKNEDKVIAEKQKELKEKKEQLAKKAKEEAKKRAEAEAKVRNMGPPLHARRRPSRSRPAPPVSAACVCVAYRPSKPRQRRTPRPSRTLWCGSSAPLPCCLALRIPHLPPTCRRPGQVRAFKEAEGADKKAAGDLQAATKTAQGLSARVDKVASALQDAQAKEKAVADKVKAIEAALEKAREQVGPAGQKSTEVLQDLNVKKRAAEDAAQVVKQKQAVADAAASKAKQAKAQAKL